MPNFLKGPIPKSYILYDCIYTTLLKWHYRNGKQMSGCQWLGRGGEEKEAGVALRGQHRKRYLCTHVQSSFTHSNQKVKLPRSPLTDESINRMCAVHTTEYYSALTQRKL